MTTQAQVSVEGTITDATGVAYFLVNGNPVLPDPSGAFLEVVTLTPGINVISLEAADPLGHRTRTALSVLSGQFLPEASVVQDAIALRLNRPAFDAIERAAAAQVASMNLAQTVMAQNPLYNGGNSLANVEVNATGATAGTPVVDLDPQAGSVRVRAEVPNVEITVNASGRLIGIPYSVTTRVAMTRAVVTADAVVTVNQGVLTTQLQNVVVDLQGFVFDISHIPTWLEGLAKNAVRNLIERQVVNLVQTTIPQQLNQALAGATGPIQKTVLGRPVTLQVLPQQVDFDADGATVMAASDVVITPPPGLQLPTTPGSLMTPARRPPAAAPGRSTPPPTTTSSTGSATPPGGAAS